MLRLNKKTEYALFAMVDMAGVPTREPATVRALAERYSLPQELLGKVLQTLKKEGMLDSIQGVKGGYILARKAENISLADIIEAIEGPFTFMSCSGEISCTCNLFDTCTIKSPLEVIQQGLENYFKSISLKDLCQKSVYKIKGPVPPEAI